MFRLLTHSRPPKALVMEMKRNCDYDAALCVWIVLGGITLPFLLCFPVVIKVMVLPLACFFGFRIYRAYFLRRILRYAEDSITVTDSLDFRLFQWERTDTFPRTESVKPFPWIQSNVPRSFRLEENEPYYSSNLFETRLPHSEFGRSGTICLHGSEAEMREFQELIEKFWAEIPPTETAAGEREGGFHTERKSASRRVKKSIFPGRKKKRKSDGEKYFTLYRGDEAIDRGEEMAERGEPEKRTNLKDEVNNRGPDSMVVISRRKNTHGMEKIELVSEKGGPVSSFLAGLSVFYLTFFKYAFFASAILTLAVYCIQWETLSPKLADCLKDAVVRFVPLEPGGEMLEMFGSYLEIRPDVRRFLDLVPLGVVLFIVPQIALWLFSRFVRWPFWKRWTLKIVHYRTKDGKSDDCRLVCEWRNDRAVYRLPSMSCTRFYKAVAANPGTNRMMTGRTWADRNPGWRMPYQLVLATSWGSLPFPCAGPEERDRVIALIDEFVFDSLVQKESPKT